jgi:hypothetical protein
MVKRERTIESRAERCPAVCAGIGRQSCARDGRALCVRLPRELVDRLNHRRVCARAHQVARCYFTPRRSIGTTSCVAFAWWYAWWCVLWLLGWMKRSAARWHCQAFTHTVQYAVTGLLTPKPDGRREAARHDGKNLDGPEWMKSATILTHHRSPK